MLDTLVLSMHITRRNWLVYKKDFLANIAPTMAEPYIMMLALGLGVGSYMANVQGRSYLAFLAPGLVVSSALFTSFLESSYGFFVRLKLEHIYKAMLTTPISPREVIFGEFIWVAFKGAFMCGVLAITMALFGLLENSWLFMLVFPLGAFVAIPCCALGLLSASLVRNINQIQSVYAFFVSPLFFFSGIFFPIEQMPQTCQWIAKSLPLYHGVRLCQMIFWNEPNLRSALGHLLILLLFSLLFGFWAYRRTLRLFT